MVKHLIFLLMVILISSCSKKLSGYKDVIDVVVQNPTDIEHSLLKNDVSISLLFKESMQIVKYDSLYANHFQKYMMKYKIVKVLKGQNDIGHDVTSVWITNKQNKSNAQFQFYQDSTGVILHNIILPD